MRNKLTDLNNHLFETLERLNDVELTGEALVTEITRSRAMTNVAAKIIENASVVLSAQKLQLEYDRVPFKAQKILAQQEE